MALKLRTRGYRRLTNPAPILSQKFSSKEIVIECSKKNWAETLQRVGYVRAVTRDRGVWVQLGQVKPLIFARQTVTLDTSIVSEYQIQIVMRSWIPWINVRLWEVLPDE